MITNFACATIELTQLILNLNPPHISLQPNEQLVFQSDLNDSPSSVPSAPITSWIWNNSGTTSPGNPQPKTVGGASFSVDTYSYTAPPTVGNRTLTLNVAVDLSKPNLQGVYGGTAGYPLTAQALIDVSTDTGAAQSITFNPVGPQMLGSSVPLIATASSGLPVAFASLTPSVCQVIGATVTTIAAGTCAIAASQPGNGAFAAAQTQRSFHVYYQGPSLHGVLIQGVGVPGGFGSVTATVNGYAETFSFGPLSTPAAVASGLAAYFSADTSSPVVGKATGSVVTFYPRAPATTGSSISASVTSTLQTAPFAVVIQ